MTLAHQPPGPLGALPRLRTELRSSVDVGRRRATPEPPVPLVFDHDLAAARALELLTGGQQAIAFVTTEGAPTGIVTAEDLRFALDWAGSDASVNSAVTQALIDLDFAAPACQNGSS